MTYNELYSAILGPGDSVVGISECHGEETLEHSSTLAVAVQRGNGAVFTTFLDDSGDVVDEVLGNAAGFSL